MYRQITVSLEEIKGYVRVLELMDPMLKIEFAVRFFDTI